MKNATLCSLLALSTLTLSAAACHNRPAARDGHGRVGDRDADHDEHGDERGAELGSGLKTNHAVNAIAKARCEREERCENIGDGKDYASNGACEAKIRADWAGDLNKYECPKGIVKAALDACIIDVRGEECGNPFDTLARLTNCSASDICDGD